MRIVFVVIVFLGIVCYSVSCKQEQEIIDPPGGDTLTVDSNWIDTLSPNQAMKHEGAYYTQADIDRAKANLNSQPWAGGWAKLISNSHAQSTYVAHPTVKLIRGGNSTEEPDPDNYSNAMNDAHAAFQLGLRWKISGDEVYAQTAVAIMNAWASTCTRVSGDPNAALALGIYGYEFAVAAEQLRDFPGWKTEDFQKFVQWMLTVFASGNSSYLEHFGCHPEHAWSNWDLCNMASLMSIGILADQRVLYNRVVNYLQKGAGNGNINRTVFYVFPAPDDYMAQMQESGRDQGHCTLSLALLTTICKIAENQGDDIWGYSDNLILKASEYVAKYNIAMLDVPYKVYSWHEGDPWNGCGVKTTELPAIGSGSRGSVRPQWEMMYNYYVKTKGYKAIYTELGANKVRPEGGGGDYGPNSGGFDQLGFGTLLFSVK